MRDLGLVGIQVPGWLMIIFGLGVLGVLLGFTMWLTFKLNPSAMDPMQQQIFKWMPVVFTFMFLSFPTGLVIYWFFSNLLSIGQQILQNRQAAAEQAASA